MHGKTCRIFFSPERREAKFGQALFWNYGRIEQWTFSRRPFVIVCPQPTMEGIGIQKDILESKRCGRNFPATLWIAWKFFAAIALHHLHATLPQHTILSGFFDYFLHLFFDIQLRKLCLWTPSCKCPSTMLDSRMLVMKEICIAPHWSHLLCMLNLKYLLRIVRVTKSVASRVGIGRNLEERMRQAIARSMHTCWNFNRQIHFAGKEACDARFCFKMS